MHDVYGQGQKQAAQLREKDSELGLRRGAGDETRRAAGAALLPILAGS
jgi:hypothetical protein